MLSPEVCVFSPPKSGREYISDLKENKVSNIIQENIFHHSILCVDSNPVTNSDDDFRNKFKDCVYYKILNVPVSEFLHCNFIQGFIDKGSISCLNIRDNANVDNLVAISEGGECTLLLNSLGYRQFGINGDKIEGKTGLDSYYINFKLSGNQLKLRKKYYRRIFEQSKLLGDFTFILEWEPHDKHVCPSSIAKYFSDKGYKVETCKPTLKLKKLYLSVPTIKDNNIDDVVEWIGMISLETDLHSDDPFISRQVNNLKRHALDGFVAVYQATGFFSFSFVDKLLRDFNSHSLTEQWRSTSLQSFTNLPTVKMTKIKNIQIEENITFFFEKNLNHVVKWSTFY